MATDSNKKAKNQIDNRFNLILIASERARELRNGHAPKIKTNNGPTITALTEVEQGLIGEEYLKKMVIKRGKDDFVRGKLR